jgi:hypothetical protein
MLRYRFGSGDREGDERAFKLHREAIEQAASDKFDAGIVGPHGRECGTLKAAGRDVGAILIAERLAVLLVGGATRCPTPPRPWYR